MNVNELKAQMVRKEKTTADMCEALEINPTTWFRKISGRTEFTQGEICIMRSVLDLDDHLTAKIFFEAKVS